LQKLIEEILNITCRHSH